LFTTLGKTLLATRRNTNASETEMTAAAPLYGFLTSLKLFMTLKITDVRVKKMMQMD